MMSQASGATTLTRVVDGVTWLGHSTVVVDLDGTRLLTDPVLRRRVAHLRRRDSVEPAQLAGIDAVLVSHVHFDHLDLPSLRRLPRSLQVVVPRGAGGLVRRRGFARVVEIEAGDELELEGLTVRATHADHSASRGPFGVRAPSLGFSIVGSQTVYFAGDTGLFPGMADIAPVDVALLPVAGWGPTLPPDHLNPQSAAEALRLLRPRVAVPIHWGTFRTPFGRRPDDAAPLAFVRAAGELAPSVEVRVLRIWESCTLESRPPAAAASPP
jgi:L-ascorbate metabolism protein UlaG (beta-lactamase superfamily)